jgi:hypothetical protein
VVEIAILSLVLDILVVALGAHQLSLVHKDVADFKVKLIDHIHMAQATVTVSNSICSRAFMETALICVP